MHYRCADVFLAKPRYRRPEYYISTGNYRCTTLDFDVKFCENFKVSRISADKRFIIMSLLPASLTPGRGFCKAVCTPQN